jgi:putative FmdB family regulatory protein
MPIYEYRAIDRAHCTLCAGRFEVRQGMNDEPLGACPQCGAPVMRLISRPFLGRRGSPGEDEPLDESALEGAGDFGPDDDSDSDEMWE